MLTVQLNKVAEENCFENNLLVFNRHFSLQRIKSRLSLHPFQGD